MTDPIKLIGNVASPYTRKMVAYLRYKRIPYEVIWGQPEDILQKMKIEENILSSGEKEEEEKKQKEEAGGGKVREGDEEQTCSWRSCGS